MYTVRCSICLQHLRTLKSLTYHYLHGHSKFKIIKQLLKFSILQSTPNLLKSRKKCRQRNCINNRRIVKIKPKHLKTETLYLNENIHILCGQNEIIIGDGKSSVDMEFSFDEASCESQENYYTISTKKTLKLDDKEFKVGSKDNSDYCSHSPSASSEGSTDSIQLGKRKIKRKKEVLKKLKHYRINITKLHNQQSLDDQNGEFYKCNCRQKYSKKSEIFQRSDLRILTSDTESCSDTGKTSFMPIVDTKIFCKKCGSGYKTKLELTNHMQVHETFCRLCNISFSSELSFKEHMRLHIFKVYICHICNAEFQFKETIHRHFECHFEDKTFETVLDMEEEYKINRYNFMSMNYNSSINSILCFLNESHDICYYSYKFMKTICDICFREVYCCDYERHLQNVHYSYNY